MQVFKEAQKNLYEKYGEKLIKCLPMEDSIFIAKLLKYELLPGDIINVLKTFPTQDAKAYYFLDHVIKPALDTDDTSSFDNLLSVMEHCDITFVEALAHEIKAELNKGSDDEVGGIIVNATSTPDYIYALELKQILNLGFRIVGIIKRVNT